MKKVETIKMSAKSLAVLQVVGLAVAFLGGAVYNNIVGDGNGTPIGLGVFIIVFCMTLVVHELLHAVGFLLAGVKPAFGIGFGFLYVTANRLLPVKPMLIAGCLPFVVLSVLSLMLSVVLPMYQHIFSLVFIVNFTGSVGDLWAAQRLWKYINRSGVIVHDQKSGIVVYVKDR